MTGEEGRMDSLVDWAGIVFGLLGFIISVVTLLLSERDRRRADALLLSQQRHEAIELTIKAEMAYINVRRQLKDIRLRARLENVTRILPAVNEQIEAQGAGINGAQALRSQLGKEIPPRSEWEKLSKTIDYVLRELKSFEKDILEDPARDFIDECLVAIHHEGASATRHNEMQAQT
jgi:hypothetical protein